LVEYKELERALLARMFRQGIIDANTFQSRVTALGFSPDDTFLMLKLEKIEAAKTVAWVGSPEPVSGVLGGYEKKEITSPVFSISGAGYVVIKGVGSPPAATREAIKFYQLDSVGAIIDTFQGPYLGVGETFEYSMGVKPGAVSARVAIFYWVSNELSHPFTSHTITVYEVIV